MFFFHVVYTRSVAILDCCHENWRGGGNAGQIKWKVAGQKLSQKLEIRFQHRNPILDLLRSRDSRGWQHEIDGNSVWQSTDEIQWEGEGAGEASRTLREVGYEWIAELFGSLIPFSGILCSPAQVRVSKRVRDFLLDHFCPWWGGKSIGFPWDWLVYLPIHEWLNI